MSKTREWGGTHYPIIARMTPPFDLIAHPNGPAITDGDLISVIDYHPDDSEQLKKVRNEGAKAWREFSWPLLKKHFYPENKTDE